MNREEEEMEEGRGGKRGDGGGEGAELGRIVRSGPFLSASFQ